MATLSVASFLLGSLGLYLLWPHLLTMAHLLSTILVRSVFTMATSTFTMATPLGVAIPLYGFDYYGYILPAWLVRSILTMATSLSVCCSAR